MHTVEIRLLRVILSLLCSLEFSISVYKLFQRVQDSKHFPSLSVFILDQTNLRKNGTLQ